MMFARAIAGIVLAGGLVTGGAAGANPVRGEHLQVSLLNDRVALPPGREVSLGLHFEVEPGWHIYWHNPGDSGLPPKVTWQLPAGFAAGELEWPPPHRLQAGPLVNYGYAGEVVFPIKLRVPTGLADAQPVRIVAHVTWLVCQEDCLPGRADLVLSLPVDARAAEQPTEAATLIAAARQSLPRAITAQARDEGSTWLLTATLPPAFSRDKQTFHFFPSAALAVDEGLAQTVVSSAGADPLVLRIPKGESPLPLTRLDGVLTSEGDGRRQAFAIEAPLATATAAVAAAPTRSLTTPTMPVALALLLAFLGGLILNLMPCVFPVLSLKVLGFVQHAHDPRAVRRHGWAYTAGVVVSFWLLGGLLLVLRAGSQKLGWGFQLQSPGFVAFLGALMFLLGLNLLGAFEIGLSLTRLGGVNTSRGLGGAFSTGVLAVVVATPCTAPFMGGALGFALTQPPVVAVAVFTSLALGMAAPYLALAHLPRLLARLPRPGGWMEIVKQALAFPLLATTVWLATVLFALAGPLGLFRFLGGLVVLAAGAWTYGRWQQSSGKPAAVLVLAILLVAAGGLFGMAPSQLNDVPATAQAGFWEPWSPARLAALRAQGRPVFVNFTAAWCLSCQVNERMVFQSDEIRRAFAARGVTAMKADWTNQDDVIARELESHGRAGVPLYLVYGKDPKAAPTTLPSVLTPQLVLDALGN